MRILLIYPPVRLSALPLYPPFGLLSIGAVLEESDIEVEILDLNVLRLPFDGVCREIKKRQFDVIGIGGMTTVYYYMKLLSLYLKSEYPGIPLIAGGSASSASPRIILEKTGFDVACIGEAESIIVDLVTRLSYWADLDDIPGIWYKDIYSGEVCENASRSRMEDITKLPFPAYHLIDMETYIENMHNQGWQRRSPLIGARILEHGLDPRKASRPIMLFTKRGCPFGCNFCYRNFGRKVVYSSVDYTLQHMDFLEKEYNTIHFLFGDEIFNVSRDWVVAFCQRIIDEGRKYILACGNGLRANVLDLEMLDVMKRAGFCSVGIGIESFYDPTLKAMKKGQNAETIRDGIRMTKESGMYINSAQMLFGYETDGPVSMEVNVRSLRELGIGAAGFSIPCPYPGTYLYDIARERGLIDDEEGWLFELADKDIADRVINMSQMPDEQLVALARFGEDEVLTYAYRKKYPIIGWILYVLQKFGRSYGFDFHRFAKEFKDSTKNFFTWGKSRSSSVRDEHIKEEAFMLLSRIGKKVRELA